MVASGLEPFREVWLATNKTPNPWKYVLNPPKPVGWVNFVRDLGDSEIVITEKDWGIDEVDFTIKHNASNWAKYIFIGSDIRVVGGYLSSIKNRLLPVLLSPTSNLRTFFEGIVSKVHPVFPDNGKPELEITVSSPLYRLTLNTPGRVTYPSMTRAVFQKAQFQAALLAAAQAATPSRGGMVPLATAFVSHEIVKPDPEEPTQALKGDASAIPVPEYGRSFHYREEGETGEMLLSEVVKGILEENGIKC